MMELVRSTLVLAVTSMVMGLDTNTDMVSVITDNIADIISVLRKSLCHWLCAVLLCIDCSVPVCQDWVGPTLATLPHNCFYYDIFGRNKNITKNA